MEPDISALMIAAETGDEVAGRNLFATLYAELHRIARRELARPGAPPSLGVTTLLHEAYLEIAERDGVAFPDRARFMGYAARVMRGLIINHAKMRQTAKRGGHFEITAFETDDEGPVADERELTEISDALDELAKSDPLLAELVDLKFFCGFSFSEIAAMRQTSERTVQRSWERARLYLHRSLRPDLSI
jgi:RNA polymerase sigma factor (TIGR02999 family)